MNINFKKSKQLINCAFCHAYHQKPLCSILWLIRNFFIYSVQSITLNKKLANYVCELYR